MEGPKLTVVGPEDDRRYHRGAWKALAAIFAIGVVVVLGVVGYFHLLGPQINPLDERSSVWEGNTYTNTALGLRVELPGAWTILDPEEATADARAVAGASEEENLGKYLISAGDMTTGTSLTLVAVHSGMPPLEILDQTMEERAEFSANQLYGGTAYQVERLEPMEVAGCLWTSYRIEYTNLSAEEFVLVCRFKEYTVTIAVIGFQDQKPGEYLSLVTAADA